MVPKNQVTKLNCKVKPYIFLCYSQEGIRYRLYDTLDHKIIIPRDVVFAETKIFALACVTLMLLIQKL